LKKAEVVKVRLLMIHAISPKAKNVYCTNTCSCFIMLVYTDPECWLYVVLHEKRQAFPEQNCNPPSRDYKRLMRIMDPETAGILQFVHGRSR
jgi:hypothetical protein